MRKNCKVEKKYQEFIDVSAAKSVPLMNLRWSTKPFKEINDPKYLFELLIGEPSVSKFHPNLKMSTYSMRARMLPQNFLCNSFSSTDVENCKIVRLSCSSFRALICAEEKLGAPKAELSIVVYFVEILCYFLDPLKVIVNACQETCSWLNAPSRDIGVTDR